MKGYSFLKQNPSLFLVWVGQVLSQSGARMFQMATLWWLIQQVTEKAGLFSGAFLLISSLPSLLLAKKIGIWIDRSSRKKILVRCDALASVSIFLAALLIYLGQMPIALVFVFGFIVASLQAFIDPTLNKSLNEIVEPNALESAIALVASTQSLANFLGAVLGAALIDKLTIQGTIFLSGLGYLISSNASRMAVFKSESVEAVAGNTEGTPFKLSDYPFIKKALIGFGLLNFFTVPTLVVLPLYTKKVLNENATTLGLLEALLWVGLILGTYLSRFIKMKSRVKISIVCLSVFGLGLMGPAFFKVKLIYGICLLICGAAIGINNVKFLSLFQEQVPQDKKGRFFAVMQGVIGATFPLGYFIFGAMCDVIEPNWASLIQGLGVWILCVYFIALIPYEADKVSK